VTHKPSGPTSQMEVVSSHKSDAKGSRRYTSNGERTEPRMSNYRFHRYTAVGSHRLDAEGSAGTHRMEKEPRGDFYDKLQAMDE
jgi:hypothetical protein